MQKNRLRELHSMKWERKARKIAKAILYRNKLNVQQGISLSKRSEILSLQSGIFLWKKLIFLTSHVNLFSSRQVVSFILEQSIITACILPLRLIVCICVQWLSTRFYEQFQIYCLSVTRNVELSGYDIFQTVR